MSTVDIRTSRAGNAHRRTHHCPDNTGRTDDVLALGQIVCTLTSVAGVDTMTFTHDGIPIAVPRADASLSPGPLTFGDYATLVAPP